MKVESKQKEQVVVEKRIFYTMGKEKFMDLTGKQWITLFFFVTSVMMLAGGHFDGKISDSLR